jgi:hypothetical protein
MHRSITVLAFSLLHLTAISQFSKSIAPFFAKEFNKETALFKAKVFVLKEVLGSSTGVVKFEIDPLAAANSGELTSLAYKCESKGKQGLILGFFGNRWNDAGVVYQTYEFLNLPLPKAKEILAKLDTVIEENYKFTTAEDDANNIYFQIDDLVFLICHKMEGTKIRVLWNNFDSEWDYTAYKRTKKRLEKQMN